MAEAKPWDAVFSQIRVIHKLDDLCPVVTEAELAAAEAALGVPLPASYRAFAMRFGAFGGFDWMLRLLPITPGRNAWGCATILRATNAVRRHTNSRANRYPPAQRERLRRFIFFGDNMNKPNFVWKPEEDDSDGSEGAFAWDPAEPTTTDPLEYPVYWCSLDSRQVERRSNSFTEFVTWVKVYTRSIAGNEVSEDYTDWIPCRARKKRSPPKRDVKRWLAFNNHTARDIARSIRDTDRVDALPILADALQDAGCAHADLLNACRTGSRIDGQWALEVLLTDRPSPPLGTRWSASFPGKGGAGG
ncbi:SMI1/KNR4 family protein [Gemmata sp. JC673]|uniref:SMI1/KNR4 family protein n=1 Tax=Gemmata algarum TaxID=2975278 RepID=A0ABU5EZ92_9BACT|nr:SMI1/KNR4 family protein [Gemmata algarum]MDY3559123.1 SMI1/KNR4 family protein [Gemmata algarum]